ncbi:hypothetical protein PACTADRAFT_34770 [Pachysolen tannophilus NRRL Y-2460]|uniref:Uncharacterized protein n=1 Tax=Pachysolen tannophilus NRRL Y-2460 TaxID=669874 RepID=A0A1E4TTM1_PACTA|nr:hypothetical protein PACTADRAFT_34770 [Pachysolen tannophilus NRRL Y-2460]
MFKNLEVLMIPRLPIVKFQILPNDIRLKLKTLCVGLCNNNNSVSNIYKNDILSFPNVENLIINLDNSTDPTFIGLVSNFLIWGETLDQIKKLTITGNCNDAISPTNIFNNENSNFQHGSSQFPQDQSLQYNKVSEETIKLNDIKDTTIENKRKSLNKISFKDKFKQNFKTCNYQSNNKNSSLSSCKVDFSDGILSSGNNTVYTSTPINTYNEKSLDNQKKITNSSSWINILEQITNFRKLKLKNLTLTKLLMESRDLDILLRSIEFFTLESLELTDILTTYDHDSCQLNSQISILLDLAPYLNRLKKLALNIKFSCKICHYDCLGYGKSHILKFFRNLSSRNLETIHLTTWEIYKIKPEMFYPFISTLKKFSWTNPKKLKSFISLVTASDKMLYDFWKEDFIETCNYESLRIKENLKTHLENNILNTVLIDDCQSPNLFKLNTFSQREEIILHNYKYQLLNVFGKTIEDFQKTFPHLELLSFFEIKFKK